MLITAGYERRVVKPHFNVESMWRVNTVSNRSSSPDLPEKKTENLERKRPTDRSVFQIYESSEYDVGAMKFTNLEVALEVVEGESLDAHDSHY